MKDKIKARFNEFKNDRFSQGILVGGVAALTTVLVMKPNFDHAGLYVPDRFINYMLETGETVLAHKNGEQVVLALVSKS